MKIGVISDTHIPNRTRLLPPALFKILADVDLILHAGDITDEDVLAELSAMAPVEAVAGNMDSYLLSTRLGRRKIINVGNFNIGLVHGDLGDGYDRAKTPQRALTAFRGQKMDCIIFGHSHVAYNKMVDDVLLFNPGSPTDPRRSTRPSCGLLTLGEKISGEIIYLP
ncbi:MAG: metallophosphoesterase [Dethiobacter sp.]|jgi:putative phosphoesterase|nr:metallophosphoesterase [Dethiobacter sp.]